jgi:hypothetical protein
MESTNLESIEQLIYRRDKHRNIIKILENTNLDRKLLKEWNDQIESLFEIKIKSKL